MSIQGEIRTLYSDREQTQAVFPRTKMSAVSDENGVGLNVLLDGKAPSGYIEQTITPSTEAELNTMLSAVLATMKDGEIKFLKVASQDYEVLSGGVSACRLYRAAANYGHASFFCYGTILMEKTLTNSAWNPLEWVNPPMISGEEYRTTERNNGEVVYAKRVPYTVPSGGIGSTSTSTSIEIPHEIPNFGHIVRCIARSGAYVLPSMTTAGGITSVKTVNGTNIILMVHKDTWSGTIFFNLYYTKDA